MKILKTGDDLDDIFLDEYGLTKWYWLVRHKENFELGENVEIGNFTVIGCEHGVKIEDDVKIGYSCTIMSESTIDDKKGKVVLKKGSKLGANSVVMPGVTIGEKAVVGANSFVNKDVPSKEMWIGSPIQFMESLEEEE